jgi:hypothetical protein
MNTQTRKSLSFAAKNMEQKSAAVYWKQIDVYGVGAYVRSDESSYPSKVSVNASSAADSATNAYSLTRYLLLLQQMTVLFWQLLHTLSSLPLLQLDQWTHPSGCLVRSLGYSTAAFILVQYQQCALLKLQNQLICVLSCLGIDEDNLTLGYA